MPGITGLIKRSNSVADDSTLATMLNCIKHEPFYTTGTCCAPELGASVGWASAGAPLPFGGWNSSRSIALLFSGELFSHSSGQNPVQNIISLYEKDGPAFVEKLNGWFSGLILDLRDQKTILFNDRYGLGRIYYHQTPEAFFFSS